CLAVCAGSCGLGNLHLINDLYNYQHNRIPILTITTQIPSNEINSSYFQKTHPKHLFAQCNHYCELISQPEQIPRVLEITIQTALSQRNISIITLPKNIALHDAVEQEPQLHFSEQKPNVHPSDDEITTLTKILNQSKKITILKKTDCAKTHAKL